MVKDNNESKVVEVPLSTEKRIELNNGEVLASVGLDNISVTEPLGPAANFREMIVQLYMRFFNKTTLDSTTLKVYNESGGAITTQTVTDDGTTKTANKAT